MLNTDKNIIQKMPHICNKCNYTTNRLDSYKKHCDSMLHMTGKRKVRSDKLIDNYKCEKCNYQSNHKVNMKIHILRNHGSKEEKI